MSDALFTVIFSILILMMLLLIVMMLRNNRVGDYRMNLIRTISDAADVDIRHNRDWHWRYKVYESVSSNRMMWLFWRRLDSFYPDKSFTKAQPPTLQELAKTNGHHPDG